MSQAAMSITRYGRFFRLQGTETVLDYGAGKLRNSLYLAGQGLTVFAADLPEITKKLRSCPDAAHLAGILDTIELAKSRLNVDLVLSTYVFNIILDNDDKEHYLDTLTANLKRGGYLLIEVRCRQTGHQCGDRCSHYFKCRDCAKTFTHEELDVLLEPRGFRRLSHYYRHQALAAVYQLVTVNDKTARNRT